MKFSFKNTYQTSRSFVKSPQFLKALVLTSSATIAIIFFYLIGRGGLGISAAIGILLSSTSDVEGPVRKKVTAILLSTTLAIIGTLIISTAAAHTAFLLPVLVVFMFFVSYLAVYGFRASLVTFSGLLAAVLATAELRENPLHLHLLFMGLGGLWYLLFSLAAYFLNPKKQTNHFLADCFELTAKYIKTRAQLLSGEKDRRELQEQLLFLQNDINEKHETLRELLISSRRSSGSSNSERQRLYIFIELVDILELAMANPVNYERMDAIFENEKSMLLSFENLILEMAQHLENLGEVVRYDYKANQKHEIEPYLNSVQNEIFKFRKNIGSEENYEAALILQSMYDYQEKQYQKISLINKIVSKTRVKIKNIPDKDATRFLTPQEYSFNIFKENFNFKSPIFRHSLRLAVVVLLGVLIGKFFELQNVYWILLTIVVILRPNYGLTKERSKQRIIGTLFGAVVAAVIVYLFPSTTVFSVLAIISLLLAFSLVQQNYKWSAFFITLNVVFIYALLSPNAFSLIQYRVLDTVIGSGLAYLGILFFWPAWEYKGIEGFVVESIKANSNYLKQISLFYDRKEKLPTSYRLSRKNAFLAMGNLSAAFQRMTQEPKSKQKEMGKIYEIVVLNQTFLSSVASLGTYMQSHQTTAASVHFKTLIFNIQHNLEQTLAQLQQKKIAATTDEGKTLEAQEYMEQQYENLVNAESSFVYTEENPAPEPQDLQEIQLVKSQLSWLLDVSEKLQKNIYLSKNKSFSTAEENF